MSFKIIGTGMYAPERIVTNDDMAKIVDTNDEWIRQRVGIAERRVSTNETTSEMGYKAAVKALESANITADDLDLILVATVSGETVSPSMSCMIQNRLGATCMAYDINAACSAFIFLLETAAGYFARKKVKNVLVVGTERMSGIVDWDDRSTCVIFGDGAGAAVLTEGDNYLDSTFTVKGGNDVIDIPHFIGKSPFYKGEEKAPYIMMKGQETFKFAVNAICGDIKKLLDDNNLTAEDIKYIVPHQANARIIDFASRKLKIPMDKFMVNIERYGNTSSASIPMVLDEYAKAGKLEKGDLLLMTAFGGGLAHAACLIRW
ncbi:MAG: beta-ketoacyl-ACP synthase III [Acutalibacteraceae bacterium]|nr:beta-ketoacyl-ACP synthase III [Acutalibacteraceae bacterium]